MKTRLKKILLAFFLLFFLVFSGQPLLAESDDDKLRDLTKKIEEYTQKINELQGEQKTLASTISYLDNKIKLTTTEIAKTEQELKILKEDIAKLSVKIDVLNKSLEEVSVIFGSRIKETYKRSLLNPFYFLLSSQGFSDVFSRIKYLQIVQRHDRDLLFQMQASKMNYDSQKELKKEKQDKQEALKKQLESQQAVLAQQKQEKAFLLDKTRNDEQEYQRLLAVARAEYEAIQGILAGYGEETKVKEVKEGEKIATLITGSSCNSSGTHLHFMVVTNGNPNNPFNYLKSVSYTNCSSCYNTQNCPCPDSDPFNPSGSWNWPLNPPIILNQGYGPTWAVGHTWVSQIYSFHNGIDIEGSSLDVKAVKDGTLYRGSYSVGCALRYVRVDHSDSDIDTYYLHVNYY